MDIDMHVDGLVLDADLKTVMKGRFTQRSLSVLERALTEVLRYKHKLLGSEHLLLGLLLEEEGLGALVLANCNVDIDRVRAQVERICGTGDEAVEGDIALTPRAKGILELALRESLSLGHNYISTEHILLGIVREDEGVAARILSDFADAKGGSS